MFTFNKHKLNKVYIITDVYCFKLNVGLAADRQIQRLGWSNSWLWVRGCGCSELTKGSMPDWACIFAVSLNNICLCVIVAVKNRKRDSDYMCFFKRRDEPPPPLPRGSHFMQQRAPAGTLWPVFIVMDSTYLVFPFRANITLSWSGNLFAEFLFPLIFCNNKCA